MTPKISIRLFGKFSVHLGDRELLVHTSGKAKEILGYLAVNRRTPVPRESLAGILSGESPVERSKKNLRQALWHLRGDLSAEGGTDAARILRIDAHWVELDLSGGVWIDVEEFERAAWNLSDSDGDAARPRDVKLLRHAVQLYRGELLQGWYHEWCQIERERLRQIYLETIDELLLTSEAGRNVEAGVAYATLALRSDPARECTHRSLMRLYCLAGDRASALHQYARCVEVLRDELGVGPDDETRALERDIRAGRMPAVPAAGNPREARSSRR